ncbi:MAG: hypothetical protein J3Q66DRAFT_368058 [Benniella sp.]|nr:MAG: hypothetical protein J3Q66DRAFT_368058 [Benniella sp.]
MKFSLIAAASAIAFAATSEAGRVNLYSKEKHGGTCKGFTTSVYGACYDVSAFKSVKSAAYLSSDNFADSFTLTFFETANCGGKWTRASGKWPAGQWQYWPTLEYVSGNVKSVWITKTVETPGNGYDNVKRPSTKAGLGPC